MPDSDPSGRSLAIIGGTYAETCQWPHWAEVFGSGLRAACALSGRRAHVELYTYASSKHRAYLEGLGASLGFTAQAETSPGTFAFGYQHSLARPSFSVSDKSVYELPPLSVEAEAILAYGMLEGQPVFDGDRVVFDPQSPEDATLFNTNESFAAHLAIVANSSEARRLSSESDLQIAGNKLLERAEVVVIKQGPQGALVFTGSGTHHVPAYRTTRTFLIGSGDIFSASFAYAWAVQRQSPEKAAEIASLSTAYYCQTATLPIPAALPVDFHNGPASVGLEPRVYLAGPFFSVSQLWLVEEARSCLGHLGAKVFSPYHDVGLGQMKDVAEADLEGLRSCDRVLALLDGYDPGTIFEIGYARARGIPVTVFLTSEERVNLTMFSGSGCNVLHDFVSAIYATIWSR
jgi:hypothetical protein